MVHEDQTISKVLTREAFENAIRTLAAIGGSTNAVIHLIAIAGRLGVKLTVDDFERLGSEMPCLVNLQPSGQYLMEDFCYAGGLPAVMKEIASTLHLGASPPTAARWARTSPTPPTSTRRHQDHGRAVQGKGRHRHPARQPGAARRGHQAQRGHAGADAAHRPRGGVRGQRPTSTPASTTTTWTSTRPASWC
jgi:dihydroxyacid dehydratase/phosphogluconate dehydratase